MDQYGFILLFNIPFKMIPLNKISSKIGAKTATMMTNAKGSIEIAFICCIKLSYNLPKIKPSVGMNEVRYSTINIIPSIIEKIRIYVEKDAEEKLKFSLLPFGLVARKSKAKIGKINDST